MKGRNITLYPFTMYVNLSSPRQVISSLLHIATDGGSAFSQYIATTLLAWTSPKSTILKMLSCSDEAFMQYSKYTIDI